MKKILFCLIIFVALSISSSYAWTNFGSSTESAWATAQPGTNQTVYGPTATQLMVTLYTPYINYSYIRVAFEVGIYGSQPGYAAYVGGAYNKSLSGVGVRWEGTQPYFQGLAMLFYVQDNAYILAQYR